MTFYNLGIVGYPLGHSLSPRLHKMFIEASLEEGGSYETFEIPEHEFGNWISTLRPGTLHGFNVTIPYKVAALPYLIELSQMAHLVGSVNTVTVKDGGLHGDNTDVYGFSASLSAQRKSNLRGAKVLILGAGGSSRAVAYALIEMGVEEITFWARNPQKGKAALDAAVLMAKAQGYQTIIRYSETLSDLLLESVQLVVNATPLGMSPNTSESPLTKHQVAKLSGETLVYDLVYNPLETKLLRDASTLGLATKGGLDMLVHQAAKSFEIWTQTMLLSDVLGEAQTELSHLL